MILMPLWKISGIYGMNALLDTHIFLWVIMGDGRLSEKARQAYLDPRKPHLPECCQFLGNRD